MNLIRKLTQAIARLLVFGLLTLLLLNIPSRSVFAHAEYDHSEPAANSVLETSPSQVRVWFTQELFRRKGENSIEVYDAAGGRVDLDDFAIDDDDRKLTTISLLPTLANGDYTVHWVATSAEDGHQAKGEFTFTVGNDVSVTTTNAAEPTAVPTVEPSPTAAVETTPIAAAQSTPTGQGATLPCLGSAAPLMMVLGAVLIKRKSAIGKPV